MSQLRSQKVGFPILFLLLLGGIGASFYLGGSVTTRVDDPSAAFIFTELRLPKTITAIVAGAALAMSGLVLQLIFRNPLAGPYVLGVSSGASLSVAIAVLTGGAMGIMDNQLTGRALMVGSAIAGGFAVTLIILLVAGKMRNNVVLLLAGLMFAQICGAL